MREIRWLPLLAAAALLASAGAAPAVVFPVDSEVDAADASPGDGVCATAGGACTLRAAVMESNLLPGPDEIELPAGTFPLSIAGVGEDAAASGDLDVTGDLVLSGAGADLTTIDALGREAAIDVVGPGPPIFSVELIVRDLTITGGAGESTLRAVPFGDATVTIERVALSENTASLGAMQCAFAVCTVRDSSIVDTIGGTGFFGGPNVTGGAYISITVERSEIARNESGGVYMGAGLFNPTQVRDSVVRDNGGDGVFCTDGPCFVEDSWIDGNAGAGVAMARERGPVIRRSTLIRNRDSAVRNPVFGIFTHSTIEDSAIVDNRSETGAGGVESKPFAFVSIRNTTISGNVGATVGGVDAGSAPGGRSAIEWSTIVGNEGGEVGGVRVGGEPPRFVASLLAGNVGPTPDCAISTATGFGNLVGDATGCAEILPLAAFAGTAAQPLDPVIGPLEDNGGPTPTHALLPGSPAIDAIGPASCTVGAPPGVPVQRDQRGAFRPRGAGCDIGAYEVPEPAALPAALLAVAALGIVRLARGRSAGATAAGGRSCGPLRIRARRAAAASPAPSS